MPPLAPIFLLSPSIYSSNSRSPQPWASREGSISISSFSPSHRLQPSFSTVNSGVYMYNILHTYIFTNVGYNFGNWNVSFLLCIWQPQPLLEKLGVWCKSQNSETRVKFWLEKFRDIDYIYPCSNLRTVTLPEQNISPGLISAAACRHSGRKPRQRQEQEE